MSRVKSGVKRVVASLAMEVVLEGVRGYLDELLKPLTPEDLYKAIKEDADPWNAAPSKVKRRGSIWARKLRKYQDRLTPELVLDWLKEDRSDLHNLIINMGPEGTKWLARRTKSIKTQLWPPEGGLKLVRKGVEEDKPSEPDENTPKIKWG
jgi:hypothetical protein